MIRNKKNPNYGPALGVLGLILTVYLIIRLDPDVWWKELLVITVSCLSVLLILIKLLGSSKRGMICTAVLFSLLLLNRFGVLDLLTAALLIIILGLISLIY